MRSVFRYVLRNHNSVQNPRMGHIPFNYTTKIWYKRQQNQSSIHQHRHVHLQKKIANMCLQNKSCGKGTKNVRKVTFTNKYTMNKWDTEHSHGRQQWQMGTTKSESYDKWTKQNHDLLLCLLLITSKTPLLPITERMFYFKMASTSWLKPFWRAHFYYATGMTHIVRCPPLGHRIAQEAQRPTATVRPWRALTHIHTPHT